jgi:hypothetical protein
VRLVSLHVDCRLGGCDGGNASLGCATLGREINVNGGGVKRAVIFGLRRERGEKGGDEQPKDEAHVVYRPLGTRTKEHPGSR